jgi:hypothetical protein
MTAVLVPTGTPPPVASSAELVTAFLAGRTAQTLRAYRQDLEDFARWLRVPDLGAAADRLLRAGPGSANALALA